MGRKTFDSIGKTLPGRDNFIISRNKELKIHGATVVPSFEHGLSLCAEEEKIFVIGGQKVYETALPVADRIYLTKIKKNIEGDTFFPPLDAATWTIKKEPIMTSQKLNIIFQFQTLSKVTSA